MKYRRSTNDTPDRQGLRAMFGVPLIGIHSEHRRVPCVIIKGRTLLRHPGVAVVTALSAGLFQASRSFRLSFHQLWVLLGVCFSRKARRQTGCLPAIRDHFQSGWKPLHRWHPSTIQSEVHTGVPLHPETREKLLAKVNDRRVCR
jgi:hypothetical protein